MNWTERDSSHRRVCLRLLAIHGLVMNSIFMTFWPQNLISCITVRKCTKLYIWWNNPSGSCDIALTKTYTQTDRLMHHKTNLKT